MSASLGELSRLYRAAGAPRAWATVAVGDGRFSTGGRRSRIASRGRPPRRRPSVSAEFWITQAFNGLSYGALLFLLASGLSLIFGVMRIVNLAHGSYFMLGGYVGLSVVWRTGSFLAALVAGAVAIALIGVGMERLFLQRLPGQTLGQALMTIGFALIFQDLALLIWGGDPYTIPVPAALQGIVTAGTLRFPAYRIFIIVVASLVGAVLWIVLDRTG